MWYPALSGPFAETRHSRGSRRRVELGQEPGGVPAQVAPPDPAGSELDLGVVSSRDGVQVPLAQVADINFATGAPMIRSENGYLNDLVSIAAPMVGGMVTSTILTLVVIPALYYLWRRRGLEEDPSGNRALATG